MVAHGVMFHHFYDDQHPAGQGAISSDDLIRMIAFLGRDRILDAKEFGHKSLSGTLSEGDICLTFDDGLLCQYDVAGPILKEHGIKGFWFVYSSVFQGGMEPLEIYRYFRTVAFDNIDSFYGSFFKYADCASSLKGFDPAKYLADDPFYTTNDRVFRYLRDQVLGPKNYNSIMDTMMGDMKFSVEAIKSHLWMTDAHLSQLHDDGHVIGLHSFRHPMIMSRLSKAEQLDEYTRNVSHLAGLLGKRPWAMSHPCNSYGPETLEVLSGLGINLGFRAYMDHIEDRSLLELPRDDHAFIMERMKS